MLAYTGVETVSNLAEEAREPEESVPNAYKLVAVAVFAIYFTLPLIALSALPVKMIDGELTTLLALPPEQGGFANDPILGVVDNLGLQGGVLRALQLYVGVLAATILFIATNAGIIGASRITYSMATYRQMPEVFRRLHPQSQVAVHRARALRGHRADRDPAAGGREVRRDAVLARRDALVHGRARVDGASPDAARSAVTYRARPNLRLRGVDWPVFAIVGGIATGISFLVILVQNPLDPLGRARLDRRSASRCTSSTAAGGCARR